MRNLIIAMITGLFAAGAFAADEAKPADGAAPEAKMDKKMEKKHHHKKAKKEKMDGEKAPETDGK